MKFPADDNQNVNLGIDVEIESVEKRVLEEGEYAKLRAEARADTDAILVGDSDSPHPVDVMITAAWGGGGIYNVIFGDDKELSRGTVVVGHLLQFLAPGDDQVAWLEEVGRYRDCWLEEIDGHQRIAVLTRLGNLVDTEQYHQMVVDIRAHELYLSEEVLEDDDSYLTFFFSVPEPDFFEDPEDGEMVAVVVDMLIEDRLEHDGDTEPIDWNVRWKALREQEGEDIGLFRKVVDQVISKLTIGGFDARRPVHIPLTEKEES